MVELSSLYDLGIYDIKPSYINWKINGYTNVSPMCVLKLGEKLETFSFFDKEIWNKESNFTNSINFYDANRLATKKLISDAGDRTITVLLSGRDSEIIVHHLTELDVDFEIFTNFYWCSDPLLSEFIPLLEDRYNKKINVFETDKNNFEKYILEMSLTTGICEPALGGLTYMISTICSTLNRFVVMGDGDIAKSHKRYNSSINASRISNHRYIVNSNPGDMIIPYISDEIAFRCWAQFNKVPGQYLFNQSTSQQIVSALIDPRIQYNVSGDISIAELYKYYYPKLVFTEKTDFFKHPTKGIYKNWLRTEIHNRYYGYNEFNFGITYKSNNIINRRLS